MKYEITEQQYNDLSAYFNLDFGYQDGTKYFVSKTFIERLSFNGIDLDAACVHLFNQTELDIFNESNLIIEESIVKVNDAIKISGVADPKGKRARLVGMGEITISPNSEEHLDYEMEQLLYKGELKESIFNGIEYYAENASPCDKVSFQVVDKTGAGVNLGLYPQEYYDSAKDGDGVLLIEEFGKDWYIMPNFKTDIVLYASRIVPGLFIRCTYSSKSSQPVMFVANLYRHLLEK